MRRALEKDIRIGLMSVDSFWYNPWVSVRAALPKVALSGRP